MEKNKQKLQQQNNKQNHPSKTKPKNPNDYKQKTHQRNPMMKHF